MRCRGVRFSYTEQNPDGIHKLVLLHPLLGSSASWRDTLSAFDDAFRVLAFDLRGFGGSNKSPAGCTVHGLADDVRSALNGVNIQRCSVIATGAGAAVAISLAARYPSLVFKLVLIEPVPFALDPKLAGRAADQLAELPWEAGALAEFLGENLYPGLDDPGLKREAEIAAGADRECAGVLGRSLASTDLLELLGQITARTLVLCGRDAPDDDQFAARVTNAAIKNSYLRTLPGRGRGILAADPGAVCESALQLLNAWDLVGGQP